MLRRYLAVSAVAHAAWELAHLPLYRAWWAEPPLALAVCIAGDVALAFGSLALALRLTGGGHRPAQPRGLVGALTVVIGLVCAIGIEWLLPFLSFDAISYVAGLTPLTWWRFALATLVGVTPVSIALVWFGDRMATVGSDWVLWGVLLLGGVTLVPLGVRALWARRRRSSQESPRGRRP